MAIEPKHVYTLVIDEDRNDVLSVMHSVIVNNGLSAEFHEFLDQEGVLEAHKALNKEIGQKEHEMGWCADANCKYPTDVKQKGQK